MKFAENNRISQRQLYRQIVIAFIAPFLLCLFRGRRNQGLSGLTGTLLAVAVFLFYVIFLIRLGYAFANPCKTAGKILGRLMGIFYLVYCILGAAFLLDLLGEIVSVSLGTGVQKVWLCVIALIVCSLGTHRGIQRRGRIGEVSGGLVLVAVVLMLLLSAGQGRWEYFQEMLWNSEFSGRRILQSGYYVICAFSGLGLLPFLLEHVDRKKSTENVRIVRETRNLNVIEEGKAAREVDRAENEKAAREKKNISYRSEIRYVGSIGKTVALAVVTLGVLLILAELLLPAVFGWGRLRYENYPILPLLAGADLPGNVLARFGEILHLFLDQDVAPAMRTVIQVLICQERAAIHTIHSVSPVLFHPASALGLPQHLLKDVQNIGQFSVVNSLFRVCHIQTGLKFLQFLFVIDHKVPP